MPVPAVPALCLPCACPKLVRCTAMATVVKLLLLALSSGAPTARSTGVTDGSWGGGAEEIQRRADGAIDRRQRAKNVILFIADGNGISTNYATRLYAGQQVGGYGDEHVLPHETMPALALSKTYNTNAQTPDSAGTATALCAGVKTKSGVLGLTEAARYSFCEDVPGNTVASIAEHAKTLGKKVGIVSTARMTHATPGGVYAHSADRLWEAEVPATCTDQHDIATQLYDAMIPVGGATPLVDVGLGGGRQEFFPSTQTGPEGDPGRRADGVDLIARFEAAGGAYAWNLPTFDSLPLDDTDTPLLGLFNPSHMEYEYDRVSQNHSEPSITQMTAAAIRALEARDVEGSGWFLMVEGGRVDHANHAGNLFRTVTEGEAYQEVVAYALAQTDDTETLIISTADHSHGLEFNGYCGRGSPITGLCYMPDNEGERHLDDPTLGLDGRPYTVGGFMNGPGSVLINGSANALEPGPDGGLVRPELTPGEVKDPDYLQQVLVPKASETHSATDVAVYAQGPSSQLVFGTMEQSWIYHVMKHAYIAPEEGPSSQLGAPSTLLPTAPAPEDDTGRLLLTGAHAIMVGVGCICIGALGGGLIGHRVGWERAAGATRTWEEERLVGEDS